MEETEKIELTRFEHSEKIKVGRSRPYLVLRVNGSSYLNKKAADILNLKHGDTLAFLYTNDQKNWYMSNDPDSGAMINKSQNLYKFCDIPMTRRLFAAMGINGKKAFFGVSDRLQEISGRKVLYIIPKPFNIE